MFIILNYLEYYQIILIYIAITTQNCLKDYINILGLNLYLLFVIIMIINHYHLENYS